MKDANNPSVIVSCLHTIPAVSKSLVPWAIDEIQAAIDLSVLVRVVKINLGKLRLFAVWWDNTADLMVKLALDLKGTWAPATRSPHVPVLCTGTKGCKSKGIVEGPCVCQKSLGERGIALEQVLQFGRGSFDGRHKYTSLQATHGKTWIDDCTSNTLLRIQRK
jgi:hypothetical protein